MPRGVRRAGLAVLLLVVTLFAPAGAQDVRERQDGSGTDPASAKRSVDEERSRLARRYDETLALEAERTAAYQQSVERSQHLAAEVGRLERSLAGVAQQLERAETRYGAALAAQAMLAGDLAAARDELRRHLSELRLSAIVAYVEASELGSLRGLNKAFDDQEGAVAVFYAGYVGDVADARVDAVEAQEQRIEQLVADAEEASEAADAARADIDARREEAQRLRNEGLVARQQADAESVRQAQLVAEVTSQREHYEQQMQALAAESARLGELLRRQAATTTAAPRSSTRGPGPSAGSGSSGRPSAPKATAPPAGGGNAGGGNSGGGNSGGGQPTSPPAPAPTNPAPPTTNNAGSGSPPRIAVSLAYPLPGWPVVSKYGWRVHPILGTRKLHEGIDIWANAGTGIGAAAGGSVVWVGPRSGYGNAVVIDHGSGVGTLYAHLSGFNVSNGQSVSRGSTIGFVGQTGLAAGPHLHFEVRVNGRTYDPLAYVRPG